MVKFGTITLPNVRSILRELPTIYSETPLPNQNIASRQYLGRLGYIIDVEGVIKEKSNFEVDTKRVVIETCNDGIVRILNLEDGSSSFNALMLNPRFSKVEGSKFFLRYFIRFVQVVS